MSQCAFMTIIKFKHALTAVCLQNCQGLVDLLMNDISGLFGPVTNCVDVVIPSNSSASVVQVSMVNMYARMCVCILCLLHITGLLYGVLLFRIVCWPLWKWLRLTMVVCWLMERCALQQTVGESCSSCMTHVCMSACHCEY